MKSSSSPASIASSGVGASGRSSRMIADEHGVGGPVDVADAPAGERAALGESDLDHRGAALLELEDAHEVADAHGLLDERRHEPGRRHRDVDAPRLVEHPLVLRVVDPGDGARHAELGLGQQGEHEVGLVVAGGGDARRRTPRAAASSRAASSQASASSHDASGTREAWTSSASLSMSSTWCPLPSSSRAMERPTLPAPAMTTRMGVSSPEPVSGRPGPGRRAARRERGRRAGR